MFLWNNEGDFCIWDHSQTRVVLWRDGGPCFVVRVTRCVYFIWATWCRFPFGHLHLSIFGCFGRCAWTVGSWEARVCTLYSLQHLRSYGNGAYWMHGSKWPHFYSSLDTQHDTQSCRIIKTLPLKANPGAATFECELIINIYCKLLYVCHRWCTY